MKLLVLCPRQCHEKFTADLTGLLEALRDYWRLAIFTVPSPDPSLQCWRAGVVVVGGGGEWKWLGREEGCK
jgi:hypothetical protein